METLDPQYETLVSAEAEDQLMMSRLNWMTYLKVLFDKLTSSVGMSHQQILNGTHSQSSSSNSNEVDIYQLLEALSQIKNLLPLQARDDYINKHGNEKGFTIQEVEFNLRRFLIINNTSRLSWDDVIDMFLSNKLVQKPAPMSSHNHNHSKYQTTKPNQLSASNIPQMSEYDDLVNISEECYGTAITEQYLNNQRNPSSVMQILSADKDDTQVQHDDRFKEDSISKILLNQRNHKTHVKNQAHNAQEFVIQHLITYNNTLGDSDEKNTASIKSPMFSPYWQQKDISLRIKNNIQNNLTNQNTQDHQVGNFLDESPSVDNIVKKIDFKDSIISNNKRSMVDDTADKNYYIQENNDRTSVKNLSKQRNDSKQTLGNTNQHCSFYLTPSSGLQTPIQLNGKINGKTQHYQYILNTDSKDEKSDRRELSSSAVRAKNTSNNNISEISSKVFSYKVPFESAFNSQFKYQKSPVSMTYQPIVCIEDLTSENKQQINYYDIVYTNQRCVSSIQMPQQQVRKELNSHLRGFNLNKNLFSRIYMFHPLQAQQLLILNMSHNLIQTLQGVEQCQNLQFLNLSHNMITDISNLSLLRQLQEVYLSHNLVSSLLLRGGNNHMIDDSMVSQHKTQFIWPFLEILDFTFNKLNDYYEVLHLVNDNAVKKDVIRIIATKGNQFYNLNQAYNIDQFFVDNDIESSELIQKFSQYFCVKELYRVCFQQNTENQCNQKSVSQSRSSINQNPLTTLGMIINQKYNQSQSIDYQERPSISSQFHHKNLSMMVSAPNDLRFAKTRIDIYRQNNNRSPSENTNGGPSRSNSNDNRPTTQLYSSHQNIRLRNNLARTSTSCNNHLMFKTQSKNRQISLGKKGSLTRGVVGVSQNLYNPKSMTSNFNQAVNELSKKLSLKDKRKTQQVNLTKIEKPLSRNVRFLDLSNNPNNPQKTIQNGLMTNRKSGDTSLLNLQNNSVNGSKSQLSFASITPIHIPNKMQAVQNSNCIFNTLASFKAQAPNKRSALNNQLKRSIDLTLGIQSSKPANNVKGLQVPNSTKHHQSNSISFHISEPNKLNKFHQKKESTITPRNHQQLNSNQINQKQFSSFNKITEPSPMTNVFKKKQSSPIKQSKLIGPLTQKSERQPIISVQITGDMAEDVDECDDDDEEPAIVVLSDKSYDKFNQKVQHGETKTSTFICKETALQKPYNQKTIKLNLSKPTGKENSNKTGAVTITSYNSVVESKVRSKKQSVPNKSYFTKL
ncbi:UNKNOWN [Stylonychia lemnae]|uniref:Leucine rich repeat family protein n=1 Tax=Stylonychia lemnae TaxID=5949 RepID=A0A078B603_STYLE|nr:UNKNOWN [Stylonychia lemnae]|eukprot:CDW88747.1 UNKNOWN [Stylonychia lemnae]